jgi:hypothetical protein
MKTIRKMLSIAVIAAAAALTTTSANADLVGHWKFDNNLTDSTNGNTGVANGGASVAATGGKIGGAVTFDETEFCSVSITNVHTLVTTNMSISFWEFSDGTLNEGYLFASGTDVNGADDLFFRRQNLLPGSIFGTIRDPDPDYIVRFENEAVTRQVWNHHLFVVDGTSGGSISGAWYINGVLAPAPTLVATTKADLLDTDLFLGNRKAGSRGFLGLMDDLQIYDVTLTADDALTLFQNPGDYIGQPPPPAGTVIMIK